MRALLEDMKSGKVATYDVPAPELREGGILVRTAFSAISSGTEKATVEAGRKSLLGKALARPDLVKQVLEFARSRRRQGRPPKGAGAAGDTHCAGLLLLGGGAGGRSRGN